MKNTFFLITLTSIILLSSGCASSDKTRPLRPNTSEANDLTTPTLFIKDKELQIEIMDTTAKREIGLSGRESMSPNSGMLFDYTNQVNAKPSFWMKDMNFDIDIIWIANQKIIGINHDVPTPPKNSNSDSLPLYPAPGEIDYVLEVLAGWSKQNNISIGDRVLLNKK